MCDCDCGTKNYLKSLDDLNKATENTSCGCRKRDYIIRTFERKIDGQKFGRLTVLETIWDKQPKVKCLCDCGNIVILNKNSVQSGGTQSCGCYHKIATSLANTKDWTGFINDYGVEFLSKHNKNNKGQWLWNCKCPICKNTFVGLPAKMINVSSCSNCKMSKGETLVKKILDEYNINYIHQYSFEDCKYVNKLRFDFALLNDKCEVFYLIEFDGIQHFMPIEFFGGDNGYENTKKRDNIKNEYCNNNNIKLLRLNYNMDINEIKENIINIIYA